MDALNSWVLELLTCPLCSNGDTLGLKTDVIHEKNVIEGRLFCITCNKQFAIKNGIPRFVEQIEDYAQNFNFQWKRFRTIQIDRFNKHTLSETRLLRDTRWSPEFIKEKIILDAGCGAGRFADVLAQHGARVVACDLSGSVDACKETISNPAGFSPIRGEVEVVQANLLAMPFKERVFDAVHCAGVIQHTPDPSLVMEMLPIYLKSKGKIFYNYYEVDSFTKFQVIKYFLRRWTPRWKMANLVMLVYLMCITLFLPSWIMSKLPIIRFFNRFLPICSVHPKGVSFRQQFDMTVLDTLDWYGPRYEKRQDHNKVMELLVNSGLGQVEVSPGCVWATKK